MRTTPKLRKSSTARAIKYRVPPITEPSTQILEGADSDKLELRKEIEVWVNEGGAGDDVKS